MPGARGSCATRPMRLCWGWCMRGTARAFTASVWHAGLGARYQACPAQCPVSPCFCRFSVSFIGYLRKRGGQHAANICRPPSHLTSQGNNGWFNSTSPITRVADLRYITSWAWGDAATWSGGGSTRPAMCPAQQPPALQQCSPVQHQKPPASSMLPQTPTLTPLQEPWSLAPLQGMPPLIDLTSLLPFPMPYTGAQQALHTGWEASGNPMMTSRYSCRPQYVHSITRSLEKHVLRTAQLGTASTSAWHS